MLLTTETAPGQPRANDVLGPQFHATDRAGWPPRDGWHHLGTEQAATERAHNMTRTSDGSDTTGWSLHRVSVIGGRVYPTTIHDEDVQDLGYNLEHGGDNSWMTRDYGHDSRGYHVFPYENQSEDAGSTSYLVHHSLIRVTESRPL